MFVYVHASTIKTNAATTLLNVVLAVLIIMNWNRHKLSHNVSDRGHHGGMYGSKIDLNTSETTLRPPRLVWAYN